MTEEPLLDFTSKPTYCASRSCATIDLFNPLTGGLIGHVPSLFDAEVHGSIEAAHKAKSGWRALTGQVAMSCEWQLSQVLAP